MSVPNLSVGQRIELNDNRTGIIRFLGTTDFQSGEWVGVELEEDTGKNDGSVQGRRYFQCPPKYGIFCKPSGVSQVLEEPRLKTRPAANGAAVKARPNSTHAGVNGIKRQSVQDAASKRSSVIGGSSVAAGRTVTGVRSPAKPAPRQSLANGGSATASSRTATPPVTARLAGSGAAARAKPAAAVASAVPGRRTSTVPPASTTPSRTARSSVAPQPASRTTAARQAPTSGPLSRAAPAQRSSLGQRVASKSVGVGNKALERNGRSDSFSPQDSMDASAAGRQDTDADLDDDETVKPNFAPPPVPPIPPDPVEKSSRSRRPSSPTAASVHSQKTMRSTAQSTRQIEELEAKLRLLERKRMEDRELRQNLEQMQQDRDRFKGIIEKLETKIRPQQQELEKLRKEISESEQRFNAIEEIQGEHEQQMELALLDREMAEETAEGLRADLDILRAKAEEMELELEVLREENSELGKEMSPEERTSAGWLQLERSNERLREALLSLRDMTQDKEAELKEQVDALEEQLKGYDGVKDEYEQTKEKLLRNEADINDLKQQLEVALNAEDMIETLTEENMNMRDRVNELRAAIEDLEYLKELNDELEINHVEAEKQLQEEIDFKDSLLLDRERMAREQQAALDEADYNINRFRALVGQLQSDLQDLEASKQISESEAAQLSNKSRAVMDLNMKLQTSAAKTQIKTLDLELGKLEAEEASEHLAIVQLFLPEAFEAERDSVMALLRFKRIGFKANLVQGFVKDRVSSFGTRDQDEDIFSACDALDKLTWIAAMSDRFTNSIRGCSIEEFASYGGALYELEVVERTLNDYIEGFRREDIKEGEMIVRLGRSIEVMTHLASLHIHDGLAEHADDLLMRALCLQSRMDSATSALTLTKTLLETHLPTSNEEDEDGDDDEHVSDSVLILNRLKTITELARNAKVVSGKTLRALSELQARSLTLDTTFVEQFASTEAVASEVVTYTTKTGAELHDIFQEEGRTDPFTPSEVAGVLSRVGTRVFSLGAPESGPYNALAGRLRDLGALLGELSALPTDLDNTVEFDRGPAPWVARSDELKRTKLTSADTEAELARALEVVRDRDATLRQKETELEEQSVRIEMLEARMKDASKRSARIAELERALHEAKDGERKAKTALAHARQEAQQEVDRLRDEMGRLADERRRGAGVGGAGGAGGVDDGDDDLLDADAMGASARLTVRRQEHTISGLRGALRFLSDENRALRLPPPDAPRALASSLDWLRVPLVPTPSAHATRREALRYEGEQVLDGLLRFVARPPAIDLSLLPENKLAWRPAKASSRWQVERRNEEWADWKQWRREVIGDAGLPLRSTTTSTIIRDSSRHVDGLGADGQGGAQAAAAAAATSSLSPTV